MPPALRTPTGIGNAAWRDPLWAGGTGVGDASSDVAQINTVLQQAGLPPNEVQAAVTAYTGLDAGSTQCILGILDGGPITLTSLAPLIGAGLVATGVGIPIVAAITALLPVLDGIIGMFSSPQETCSWKVGNYCVHNKTQPFGPTDTGRWETWATFAGGELDPVAQTNFWAAPAAPVFGTQARNWEPADVKNRLGQDVHTAALWEAFQGYINPMAAELFYLNAQASRYWLPVDERLPPQDQFRRVYYHAWQAANEYAINGYKSPDYYALLQACAQAWNRGHAASSTYTFQQQNLPANTQGANPIGPWDGTTTYIGLLLNGSINSSAEQPRMIDHPPVMINTGSRIDPMTGAVLSSRSMAGSTSMSTGEKVAIGSAVVAGGAALGVGIWAFATHQAYGAAWGKVWSGVKKPFKKR